MRNRASIRQWIGGVLSRVPAPFLVFLGGGTGALCRVYTPGGVLVANLLGSFTLGLLTMVWNAYAVHHQLHVHDAGCGGAAGGWFGRRRGWHADGSFCGVPPGARP